MTDKEMSIFVEATDTAIEALVREGFTVSPEAQRAIERLEFVGFHWWFAHHPDDEFIACIRIEERAWTLVDEGALGLSEAICAAYDKLIELLPGVAGIHIPNEQMEIKEPVICEEDIDAVFAMLASGQKRTKLTPTQRMNYLWPGLRKAAETNELPPVVPGLTSKTWHRLNDGNDSVYLGITEGYLAQLRAGEQCVRI